VQKSRAKVLPSVAKGIGRQGGEPLFPQTPLASWRDSRTNFKKAVRTSKKGGRNAGGGLRDTIGGEKKVIRNSNSHWTRANTRQKRPIASHWGKVGKKFLPAISGNHDKDNDTREISNFKKHSETQSGEKKTSRISRKEPFH